MSMAAFRNTERWGSCIAYGPPITFGLPVEVPAHRPMVIAHPAAAVHYHASFGLVADGGHPFIHVMVDIGDHAPDAWDVNANEAGMATWQRIADTTQGHKVYRKVSLDTAHWQLHIPDDAFSRLTSLPPLDVLYLDWLQWLEPHASVSPHNHFGNAVSAFVHKIREGGLVVLDHKHINMREDSHPWYANINDAFVHLNNGSMLANQGLVEWLSPDLHGDYHSHMATVFKVHHGINGPLINKDWEQAMVPWTWMTMPEVSMTKADIQHLLVNQAKPTVHPDVLTQDEWMVQWLRYIDPHEPSPMWLGPTPPIHPWPSGAYARYLQWLLRHPQLLVGDLSRRSYHLLGEAFKLHIVHGDLLRIAPALHGSNTALAVREPLRRKVVGRCPRWLGQTLMLQSSEPWMPNPVKGLQWSGENATPMLAKTMLEFAKMQPLNSIYSSIQTMQVNHVVTVSHGTASLGEVMRAVMSYYDDLPPVMARAPMEMTIVCLDEDDYTDLHTVPHQFQFLPDDGSCAD